MKMTLLGSFVTAVVSVMLMIDVPVKANDQKARGDMVIQRFKGGAAASKTLSRLERRNAMRMLWEERIDATTIEVVSRLKEDWAAGIQVSDQRRVHMLISPTR